ncbi:uncharacterized protein LOC125946843 [Dermacentor silvarum]|uniref:uncharacterized protein LOC125946843 n=1 Tax=Dermacentor silvarum TaxID=543639 RepID=UPI0021018C84|nr:uncharacterized protein LOC125946843 [Dermacentor silvarum]
MQGAESTVRWTHVRCLEEYMNRVHSNRCNICKKRMAAIIRQKSIWAWFRHPSTRRHQVELALAMMLSVTMMPVLYMAWAYAFFHVAPQVNWAVALVLTPYLIFQTSTWLGFAAYSFWADPKLRARDAEFKRHWREVDPEVGARDAEICGQPREADPELRAREAEAQRPRREACL